MTDAAQRSFHKTYRLWRYSLRRCSRKALQLLLPLLLVTCAHRETNAQATSQATNKASQLQDNAILQALRQGQNDQALSLSRAALAQHPADCKLLSLQAMAHTGLGHRNEALHSFLQALTHCPTYLPALEGAAEIEYARKDAAAVPLLTRIVSAQPGNETAQAMLATLLRNQNCTQALPHFKASQSLLASRPEFQQEYAFCLAETGDLAGAREQYQQLAAAHPSDAVIYDAALLQWKAKAPAEALATLEPLLKAGRFEPAFSLASSLCEESGDTPRAVSLLRTAIALNPEDQENYLAFSRLAFDHNSFPVGVEMLNAGLKHLPEAASLYLARGVLEVQMDQVGPALADFETAHRLDDKLSFAIDAMGLVLTQEHKNAASLTRFQTEAKQHPQDAFLQYLLAEQLSEIPDEPNGATLTEAIAAAKASTTLEPGYQPAQDLLIVLYMRAKQPDLALKEAEAALARNPADESALYQELLARRRLGQTQELQGLMARLMAARRENAAKQEKVNRYRLLGTGNQ